MPSRRVAEWDNARITLDLDYDATNVLTAIRVINAAAYSVFMRIVHTATGREVSRTFAPGVSVTIALPTTIAQRLTQVAGKRPGWYDGLDIHCVMAGS